MEQIAAVERRTGVVSEYLTASGRFAYLLEALHGQTGRPVVVLVDEYDKPILDAMEDPQVAPANRDYLRGVYGVIKAERRARAVHVPHRGQQVLEGEPLLRAEQPDRHHA